MAAYNNFIITNQGIEILKGLMNGNGSMEFRCLAVGSGYYDPEKNIEEIRAMEGLKEERQRAMFSSIGKSEDGFVCLKANLTNKDLEEGYPMTEAGIYVGKKGESAEILYCVSITDKPDYMPDYSSKKIYNVVFKMLISIGDVANPTISYRTDIYALAEDLQEEVGRAVETENELQQRKLDIDGNASNVIVEVSEATELRPMASQGSLSELLAASAKGISVLIGHLANTDRIDNTSDMDKPVSVAQQEALDALHQQLTNYTDQEIAALIGSAPSTLDTLGEIAQAMRENESVVDALNEAVGKKVDLSMLASYLPLAGGIMSGDIITARMAPAANKRYAIGESTKRYSGVWAVKINTNIVSSPQDADFLLLESQKGSVQICPDVSDYINVIIENIDDGNGNINGALYAMGGYYPEHKENWLGTFDHPWDNVFASKINSKPIPACSISGTTLYINF